MRAWGIKSSASFLTRLQVIRSFWLRRRSDRRQRLVTWCRNVLSARLFVGTAWYSKKPATTCRSHFPCSGTGWCLRLRISSLISLSFARMRSLRDFRFSAKRPRRDRPQMNVNPRNLKVPGLPRLRRARWFAAKRPNSIRRVLSGEATTRTPPVARASHPRTVGHRSRTQTQR
jgi:hypothetical protein